MFKNFMLKWWGVAILSVIYLYVIELFNEYVISREMIFWRKIFMKNQRKYLLKPYENCGFLKLITILIS